MAFRKTKRLCKQTLLRRAVTKMDRHRQHPPPMEPTENNCCIPPGNAITVVPLIPCKPPPASMSNRRIVTENVSPQNRVKRHKRIKRQSVIANDRSPNGIEASSKDKKFNKVSQPTIVHPLAHKDVSTKMSGNFHQRSKSGLSLGGRAPVSVSTGTSLYPSTWKILIGKEKANCHKIVCSLTELVNCDCLNRTPYDHKLGKPPAIRRSQKSTDYACQCQMTPLGNSNQDRPKNLKQHTNVKAKTKAREIKKATDIPKPFLVSAKKEPKPFQTKIKNHNRSDLKELLELKLRGHKPSGVEVCSTKILNNSIVPSLDRLTAHPRARVTKVGQRLPSHRCHQLTQSGVSMGATSLGAYSLGGQEAFVDGEMHDNKSKELCKCSRTVDISIDKNRRSRNPANNGSSNELPPGSKIQLHYNRLQILCCNCEHKENCICSKATNGNSVKLYSDGDSTKSMERRSTSPRIKKNAEHYSRIEKISQPPTVNKRSFASSSDLSLPEDLDNAMTNKNKSNSRSWRKWSLKLPLPSELNEITNINEKGICDACMNRGKKDSAYDSSGSDENKGRASSRGDKGNDDNYNNNYNNSKVGYLMCSCCGCNLTKPDKLKNGELNEYTGRRSKERADDYSEPRSRNTSDRESKHTRKSGDRSQRYSSAKGKSNSRNMMSENEDSLARAGSQSQCYCTKFNKRTSEPRSKNEKPESTEYSHPNISQRREHRNNKTKSNYTREQGSRSSRENNFTDPDQTNKRSSFYKDRKSSQAHARTDKRENGRVTSSQVNYAIPLICSDIKCNPTTCIVCSKKEKSSYNSAQRSSNQNGKNKFRESNNTRNGVQDHSFNQGICGDIKCNPSACIVCSKNVRSSFNTPHISAKNSRIEVQGHLRSSYNTPRISAKNSRADVQDRLSRRKDVMGNSFNQGFCGDIKCNPSTCIVCSKNVRSSFNTPHISAKNSRIEVQGHLRSSYNTPRISAKNSRADVQDRLSRRKDVMGNSFNQGICGDIKCNPSTCIVCSKNVRSSYNTPRISAKNSKTQISSSDASICSDIKCDPSTCIVCSEKIKNRRSARNSSTDDEEEYEELSEKSMSSFSEIDHKPQTRSSKLIGFCSDDECDMTCSRCKQALAKSLEKNPNLVNVCKQLCKECIPSKSLDQPFFSNVQCIDKSSTKSLALPNNQYKGYNDIFKDFENSKKSPRDSKQPRISSQPRGNISIRESELSLKPRERKKTITKKSSYNNGQNRNRNSRRNKKMKNKQICTDRTCPEKNKKSKSLNQPSSDAFLRKQSYNNPNDPYNDQLRYKKSSGRLSKINSSYGKFSDSEPLREDKYPNQVPIKKDQYTEQIWENLVPCNDQSCPHKRQASDIVTSCNDQNCPNKRHERKASGSTKGCQYHNDQQWKSREARVNKKTKKLSKVYAESSGSQSSIFTDNDDESNTYMPLGKFQDKKNKIKKSVWNSLSSVSFFYGQRPKLSALTNHYKLVVANTYEKPMDSRLDTRRALVAPNATNRKDILNKNARKSQSNVKNNKLQVFNKKIKARASAIRSFFFKDKINKQFIKSTSTITSEDIAKSKTKVRKELKCKKSILSKGQHFKNENSQNSKNKKRLDYAYTYAQNHGVDKSNEVKVLFDSSFNFYKSSCDDIQTNIKAMPKKSRRYNPSLFSYSLGDNRKEEKPIERKYNTKSMPSENNFYSIFKDVTNVTIPTYHARKRL